LNPDPKANAEEIYMLSRFSFCPESLCEAPGQLCSRPSQ
jgi:hypothetical protein